MSTRAWIQRLPRAPYWPEWAGPRPCSVIGCPTPHKSAGYCQRHYAQARKGRLSAPVLIEEFQCGFGDCDAAPRYGMLCRAHASQHRRYGYCWAIGTCRRCNDPMDEPTGPSICSRCTSSPGYRHGLSWKQYDALVAAANGKCQICGKPDGDGKNRLHVDHDHRCCSGSASCGKCVRGLLCGNCNRALGMMHDDVDRLLHAAIYLESRA